MKNKFSDNTSNTDSSPERNPEPTEKGEIKLLDVVELTQDVPEHNLKRGALGMVVEILSNGEAYKVEFSPVYGQMSEGLSFLASQLKDRKGKKCHRTTPHQSDGKTATSH